MSWFRRLFSRSVRKEIIPTALQQERRTALAKTMRSWAAREDELLDENVVSEYCSINWFDKFGPDDPDAETDNFFNDSLHFLQHFFSDADIRKSDPKFAALEMTQLTRCIERLEGNLN